MKSDINLEKLLGCVDVPAQWVGLREVYESNTPRMIRDGVPVSNHFSSTHGIMVEVLVDGQFGYYGTPDMSSESISKLQRKHIIKQTSFQIIYLSLDESARPAQKHIRLPYVKSREELSAGRMNSLLLEAYKHLKVSDKIVSASSLCEIIETEFRFLSSNGSDINQSFLMLGFDLRATAADGTNQQTRTFGGMRGNCKQVGLEYLDELEVVANASKIGEQALELLNAEECPTGDLDIIIAPDQMMLQIHESIGHALEVDRILGDERNYADEFVKLEDFGKLQYGSDVMNITFDPSVASEFASYGFDDGGLKAKKEYLIKDGLLVRGLGGQKVKFGLCLVCKF